MKRSPLSRKTPLRSTSSLRRTRLKPRSQVRTDEEWEWQQTKATVDARDRGICVVGRLDPSTIGQCSGRRDPHHLWPTGAGGPRLDVGNVVTVCRIHHDVIHHDEPRWARSHGLLRGGPYICRCRICPRCGVFDDDDHRHPEDGLAFCGDCSVEWWASIGPAPYGTQCPRSAAEQLEWDIIDGEMARTR